MPTSEKALLSSDGRYFMLPSDQRPLRASEVLSLLEDDKQELHGFTIWQSYWECTFFYSLAGADDSKLRLGLKLSNKNTVHTLEFPQELKVDYILHEGMLLPIRPSVALALEALIPRVFADKDPNLSVIELLALEYFAAEHQIKLENLSLRQTFLAGSDREFVKGESELLLRPYPYQIVGIEWLESQQLLGKPGVLLCDVMGLGKTLQGIGLIVKNLRRGLLQNLVVCPSTLVENWRREFAKFAPEVSIYVHSGPNRSGVIKAFSDREVVITSYDTLLADFSILHEVAWNVVLIDEAQAIKNPSAKRALRAKSLKRSFSVAITGTPLENSLLDLWSLVDFANPQILGEKAEFERQYADDLESAGALAELVKPVMLRRQLHEIESQLPEKTIVDHPLDWPEALVDVYESVRRQAWDDFPTAGGLVATTRLRQLATHPRLLGIGSSNLTEDSPKFQLALTLVEELIANGEKALVFTSYNEMIDSFVLEIGGRFPETFVHNLDGRVPIQDRQDLIERFNSSEGSGVLICNPVVAGAGLNITGANHVIHYNLEWNPAKEDQATFRVYRNGQTKHTFVHRLFYIDTIDEVIDQRILRKRQLADLTVDSISDVHDYKAALSITPKRAR
jgi:SNF2 family DNA or RNA helicase